MNPTLVVMAAGMGSRYGGVKQIDTFGPSGETIVDYTVYDALRVGFRKVVFIIRNHLLADVKEKFSGLIDHADVEFVYQELDSLPVGLSVPEGREKPWGTGHAVWTANQVVDEPFVVVNADDYYGRSALKVIYDHLKHVDNKKVDACLVAYQLKNTLSDHGSVSRGICEVSEDGSLKSITEKTEIYKGTDHPYYVEDGKDHPLTGNEPVSMNLMGFTSQVFKDIETDFIKFYHKSKRNLKAEYYIPTVLDNVRKSGSDVPVLFTDESWFGVTYKEDKVIAQKKLRAMIDEGIYPKSLWGND
ncbi:MAG: sugar phosphate nucleotidyltransferase [Cyclobacteriaceae bacterium]